MKKAEKLKAVPKGCVKISNFFKVQASTQPIKKVVSCRATNETIIEITSSDDEAKTTQNSTPRKRKLSNSNESQPVAKKTNESIATNGNIHPSTSERQNIESPTKWLSVKSPEKLLTSAALKELNHTKSTKRRKSPRKAAINGDVNTENNSKVVENGEKTPVKKSPIKEPKSSTKSQNSVVKSSPSSPSKRRTPKKLFERSPNNLEKFNVEVIEKFVKVTPSKSNKSENSDEEVKSSTKRQSSIKKFFTSPGPSNRSLEAQAANELTPTKSERTVGTSDLSPVERAKTKLDFASCTINKINQSSPKKHNGSISNSPTMLNSKANQENNANLSNVEFNFDDSWDGDIQTPENYDLNLTESQHCRITAVTKESFKTCLIVKSTKSGEQAKCFLEGFWVHAKLCIGDIIHISAKKIDNDWVVDNQNGLLVYEPDLLVSTTTITGTVFCRRKSVFQEKFRGFEPTNKYMIVGTLVHSLLEKVLKAKLHSHEQIENVVKEMINDENTIRRIYESGETLEYISDEILNYVPKIVDFIRIYVNNSNMKPKNDQWQGKISSIEDIEENIWCPDLGIKGKVDVSVRTDQHILPLELKTGRASVSVEHRGQVMLYIMMMNKLGYAVPSGLLLYLKEGVVKEVPMTIHEKRDIILLRNELTYFLLRQPKIIDKNNEKHLVPAEVPEIIDHPSCSKCPYNVICSSYARYTKEDISKNKSLNEIKNQTFEYLTDDHLQYFMKWVSLIALESNDKLGSKDLREIYTLTPDQRERNGKCIVNLRISNIDPECNGTFLHTFKKCGTTKTTNFFSSGINENSYVIVSTDSRPAVATGFVSSMTSSSLSIFLDRNLDKKYSGKTFHVDTYDSNTIQSYNLAGLSLLLEPTPKAADLRRIIIDKGLPTFNEKLPKTILKKGTEILKRLNKVQQRAVLRGLAAKDYLLIKGMPGTGKTATIVALVQLLVELNKTVIITSHTHSAVDNVCLRLITFGVKFMRLGNERKMQESLKKYSEYNLTKDCKTPDELAEVYNSAQVLAVTCLGSGHPVLTKRTMDVCIVDESTQVLQCSVIRPLYAAKTFILIGDPDQLPAVVKNKDAVNMGMNESLFERLHHPKSVQALNVNYRMNKPITALANHLTYNNELLIGSNRVADATLTLPSRKEMEAEYDHFDWLIKSLDDRLENSVCFIETGQVWKLRHEVKWQNYKVGESQELQNCVNVYEAAVVAHLVKALIKGGLSKEHIGVIATYRAQVAQISSLLTSENVDISTIDQFQGKDKNVIIFSCTKSKDPSTISNTKFDLLEDKRRLTVAITRAKHKLIIVGDEQTLQCYSAYRKLLSFLKNVVRLEDNENGFDWKSVLDL